MTKRIQEAFLTQMLFFLFKSNQLRQRRREVFFKGTSEGSRGKKIDNEKRFVSFCISLSKK